MSSDLDRDTMPGDPTEPYTPTFHTGEIGLALDPLPPADLDPATGPLPALAPSIVVAGSYQYLKRWTFVLVVIAVWIAAALIGLGLFYWWFHSADKTPPVFLVLVYLVVSTVGGLLTAMAGDKPLMSALAIAVMSAPLASTAAAAVLYGVYFCERASRCFAGVIPY